MALPEYREKAQGTRATLCHLDETIELPASNRTAGSEYYPSTTSTINLVRQVLPEIQEVFRIPANERL